MQRHLYTVFDVFSFCSPIKPPKIMNELQCFMTLSFFPEHLKFFQKNCFDFYIVKLVVENNDYLQRLISR